MVSKWRMIDTKTKGVIKPYHITLDLRKQRVSIVCFDTPIAGEDAKVYARPLNGEALQSYAPHELGIKLVYTEHEPKPREQLIKRTPMKREKLLRRLSK